MSMEVKSNSDSNKELKAANPAFRIIRSPEKPENSTKQAIANLLTTMGSALPEGVINSIGGPLIAGGIVSVVASALVVALPVAFLSMRGFDIGISLNKKHSGPTLSFSRLFRSSKDVSEDVLLDPNAIRSLNIENEGPHPDDQTSLGFSIPEPIPGSDERKEEKVVVGGEEAAISTYGQRKLDPKQLAEWKGRFGSSASDGSSQVGAGAPIGIGSGAKISEDRDTGRQIALGSAGTPLSIASGKTARVGRQAIRTMGRLGVKEGAGSALGQLKAAAHLTQRGPAIDQIASGLGNAAFGEAPKAAGVIAGGPAATVEGAVTEGSSIRETELPEQLGASGDVLAPEHPKKAESSSEGMSIMMMLAAIVAAVLVAKLIIPKLWAHGMWGKVAAWAIAIITIGGLALALNKMRQGDPPAWSMWIFVGLTAAVSAALIHAAATGASFIDKIGSWIGKITGLFGGGGGSRKSLADHADDKDPPIKDGHFVPKKG